MSNILRKNFRYTYFNATIILIAINTLVFLFTRFNSKYIGYLSLNPSAVVDFHMYWQLVTCNFIHANLLHLFLNMFGLFMFGRYFEKSIGSKEFLLYYFVCGILSSAFSLLFYVVTGNWNVQLMGASGILYSILFAFAVIFPTVRVYIYGIIPVPAPILVLLFAGIEIVCEIFGFRSNVAHMTHLFGFVAAWLYFIIRLGVNPIRVWKNVLKH